jgi:hypothetical protein
MAWREVRLQFIERGYERERERGARRRKWWPAVINGGHNSIEGARGHGGEGEGEETATLILRYTARLR